MQQRVQFAVIASLCCWLMNVRLCWTQSCVEAGYTSCCDQDSDADSCEGRPLGVCFCDPSCHEFNDCCDDITEICHPERDDLLSNLKPLAVFTSGVTYQSVTVHWVTMVYTNTSATGTDSELAYILHLTSHSHSNMETNYLSNVIARPANYTGSSEHYTLHLPGLEAATEYSFSLTAVTWFGELLFEVNESFTTGDPSSLCVSGVQLTVMESSSLLVSWYPLSLLPGVRVTGHVIRYHELPLRHEETQLVNSSSTSAVISGLNEGVSYSFVVMAIITEAGGRALSSGECTESNVFVPEARLFQLTFVGTFSSGCVHWRVEEELALSAALRVTVVTRIREILNSSYSEDNVHDDYIICHSTSSGCYDDLETSQRLTYRATLLSTSKLSLDSLIGSLRTWSQSHSELALPDNMSGHTPLTTPMLLVDTDCPMEVRTRSHPLCDPSDLSTSSPVVESGFVSVPVFVASLAAVVLFLVVVTMVIVVCMLMCSQSKIKKDFVTGEGTRTIPASSPELYNTYTPTPSSNITMTTHPQDHTHNRPLAIRVTDSSSSGPTVNERTIPNEGEGPEDERKEHTLPRAVARESVHSTQSRDSDHITAVVSSTV